MDTSPTTQDHADDRWDPGTVRRYRSYRIRIFAITWLAYIGFYLTRKAFAVAKVDLQDPDGLAMTTGQMAWIDGGYLAVYAAGQFFWGICGDRFGTRKVIITGMLGSVVVAAAMGGSSVAWLLGILFCIQGACQSSGWAPLSKNIGEFFSQAERGRVMGFWCTNYALGGVIASAIAGWAADAFGWRYAFWVPAAVLLGIWGLFLVMQRNRPEDVGLPSIEDFHGEPDRVIQRGDTPADEREGSWDTIREVLTNRMVWLLAGVYLLLKPTRYFILFWSPLYINARLGVGAAEAGILGSMFDLAGPISVLFGGYVSDVVFKSKRIPISVIALVVVAAFLFFFPALPDTRVALGLGFFIVGFFLYIPDSLVSGTAAIDFGTKRGASTAAGMVNGFGSIGAIAGGTMPGWIGLFIDEGAEPWPIIFTILGCMILLGAAILLPKWNALPPAAEEPTADPTPA